MRLDGCPDWCTVTPEAHAEQALSGLDGLVHDATWADDEGRWCVDAGVATDSQGELEEMPHLIVGCDHLGLSTEEARALAAAILEAADALDVTELLG